MYNILWSEEQTLSEDNLVEEKMEQYVIKGGRPLRGHVEIYGAKNAALPLIAAAVLTDEAVIIDNLPDVSDVNVLLESISRIGATVERINRHKVRIVCATVFSHEVTYELVSKIRASYYLLGSLLGKYKEAEVAMPGGCVIGSRPIDLHIKGFEALGADVEIKNGMVKAKADRLLGRHIYFDNVSVGATINVMMAACMAEGNTIIENAAKEPHVVDLANMLNSMGARIRGAGTDVIRIRGVESLHGTEYTCIPDQIEAGTFMFAAAVTGGDITVTNVIPKHLEAVSSKLADMGCDVVEYDESVRVIAPEELRATTVKTMPYPGFPTDMQPQMTVALNVATGISTVTENIFENRFKYVAELARMGARVKVESNIAVINGPANLQGTEVVAPDLRAGAALVLAGLAADGITYIRDIFLIQRGYENFEGKLQSLGADIERMHIQADEEEILKAN